MGREVPTKSQGDHSVGEVPVNGKAKKDYDHVKCVVMIANSK
jgi:hypothetical protein